MEINSIKKHNRKVFIPGLRVKIKLMCILLLSIPFFLGSCYKMMEEADTKFNINYDAAYVVNGESNSISIIDLQKNEVKETLRLEDSQTGGHTTNMHGISWPHHVYLNPSKDQISLGIQGMDLSGGHTGGMPGMKGMVVILNAITGEIIKTVDLPVINHNAAFSPDGKEIWTSQISEMGQVLVYDASTYILKNTIEVQKQPTEVTFSSDGQKAFVANRESNSVTAINVNDKSVIKSIAVGADPIGAWPGKDNKMYVNNEEGKTVSVIDAVTLDVLETVELDFMPGMAAYNLSKNELWVSDADNGKVVFFQRMNKSWMKMGSIETGSRANAIAFSKDEKTAYVSNQMAESVSVVNADTKEKIKDIKVGKKPNGITIKQ